jgi:FHS family glucose/mannose:H+ symporter-like MFS transporter
MTLPGTDHRVEVRIIYLAGLVQGLALVTFPAASAIFTSSQGFAFSSTRYGMMFVPQVVLAIAASSLGPAWAQRWSLKRVLLLGLAGDLISMILLALSARLESSPELAYGLLLAATGALGFGFGATVMALNTYTEEYSAGGADRAVLALNALLGTGTALAPLFVAIFVALGAWWLLPVTVAVALVAVLLLVSNNPFRSESHRTGATGQSKSTGLASLPARFWLYAALVLLYGVVETLNGNWATIYLGGKPGISARGASLGLTAFWATVTAGRIFFSALSKRISVRWIYIGLPMFLIVAFPLVAQVQSEIEGILAFAFAGLACSAFLPLSISLGGREFAGLSTLVSGELIAFYQVGYGVAAFGVGPLRDPTGLSFSRILSLGSIAAGAMVVLAWLVIRRAESHCSQLAP